MGSTITAITQKEYQIIKNHQFTIRIHNHPEWERWITEKRLLIGRALQLTIAKRRHLGGMREAGVKANRELNLKKIQLF